MAQTKQFYRVVGITIEDVVRTLNFSLQSIADRLDAVEGLRGNGQIHAIVLRGA